MSPFRAIGETARPSISCFHHLTQLRSSRSRPKANLDTNLSFDREACARTDVDRRYEEPGIEDAFGATSTHVCALVASKVPVRVKQIVET